MPKTRKKATLLIFFEPGNMHSAAGPQELRGEIIEHAVIEEATYYGGVGTQGPRLELKVEFQGPCTNLAAGAKAACEERYGRVTKLALGDLQGTG